MKIELNLYASYGERLPENATGSSCRMDLDEGTTIRALLDRVKLTDEDPKIIFRNGVHAKMEDTLHEGDRVAVFPPVAGG
jgi:molybdopterin converting factor small subunit